MNKHLKNRLSLTALIIALSLVCCACAKEPDRPSVSSGDFPEESLLAASSVPTEGESFPAASSVPTEGESFLAASSVPTEGESFPAASPLQIREDSSEDLPEEPQPPAPAETIAPEPLPSVTLRMVGDVLLHTPVEKSVLTEDGRYDYDVLFARTSELITEVDLALVNQEVIIGGAELGISGYPCFNADFSLCDALSRAGFDIVCHATNHALDKGRQGLVACAENWATSYPDMQILGIHSSPETSTSGGAEPYIYEQDGLRIAVLNYTYGTNGIPLPKDMPYAVDLLQKEQVLADIRQAEELADFTIVCPHWGTEYRLTPDASQEKWVKLFAENGVDLVLGTHPHVIEPIQWVTHEETGHQMLVYYSLGNFVNWTSGTGAGVANRMVGGMADVTISKDQSGAAYISDYGILALVSHVQSGPGGVTTYPLSAYTKELEAQNEISSQDPSFSLDYCIELCDTVWGDLWR